MVWQIVAAGAALASSLIGGRRASRSQRRAEEETARRAAEARLLGQDAQGRTQAAYDRATGRLYDRAERGAGRAALMERAQVLADEQTRFTRLRSSAEAAGFNPLTLLASGYLGTDLPTGFLSAADHLQQGVNRAASVGTSIQLGMSARDQAYNELMGGHEAALNAGAQAYQQSSSFWNGIGDRIMGIGSAFSDVQGLRQQDRALDLDERRFEFDREQFAWEREFNTRQAAMQGRLAGFGQSLHSSAQGGGFSAPANGTIVPPPVGTDSYGRPRDENGNLVSQDYVSWWGGPIDADETMTPADVVEATEGEIGAAVQGSGNWINNVSRNWQNIISYRWSTGAWARDWVAEQWNAPLSQAEIDLSQEAWN